MEICVVISPDKLSMSMFCDFFQNVISESIKIVDFNCLNSKEMQDKEFEGLIGGNISETCLLIKYKTKPQTKLSLPPKLEEKANYIIKFDLFSMHPELVKDTVGDGKGILEKWMTNVLKMDKTI
jgi:hypothetical protein